MQATDNKDQKISGVSVVIRLLSQFKGVSQNNTIAHAVRSRSIDAKPHHIVAPKANGNTMAGQRIANVLSPKSRSMAATHQPAIGGWS